MNGEASARLSLKKIRFLTPRKSRPKFGLFYTKQKNRPKFGLPRVGILVFGEIHVRHLNP